MSFGKSIRIFLSNGAVTGIRQAELLNWTGQAILCPRSRFSDLDQWPESNKPGVYFLIESIDASEGTVYVGQAENVHVRLKKHHKEKDFWNEVVFFTSRDENLTRGHVLYLESKLTALAREAGRFTVANGNEPSLPSLPRSEASAMDEFVANVRLLMGALGHRFLEPIARRPSVAVEASDTAGTSAPDGLNESAVLSFAASDNSFSAQGYPTDEGFVVLAGSRASKQHLPSLSNTYVSIRERLRADGSLVETENGLRFTRDALFTTSTAAAGVVAGTSRSGPASWKSVDGFTLKELEAKAVDGTENNEVTSAPEDRSVSV